jgi:hypothetical protein
VLTRGLSRATTRFRSPCDTTGKNAARLSSGPAGLHLRTSKLTSCYGVN